MNRHLLRPLHFTKNIVALFFFMCLTFMLSAADSTEVVKGKKIKFSTNENNSRLYNYTNSGINYFFNEDLRDSATWRSTVCLDYAANSKEMPAGLVFGLLFKQNITRGLIDRIDGRINDRLRFEDQLKTGYTLRHYVKRLDCSFFFTFNHRQMRELSAGKEAFELAFYGNARFEGDSADLSNIRFYNYLYNQVSAGVKKKFDYGNYQMDVGLGLSFLQVFNQQEIRTGHSSIYTAVDGEYLDFNYDLTFNTAKEGATKFGQLNGIGGSGDFHIAFMNKNKWKLSLDVADIGYTFYRKNPVNYSAVKSAHFAGFVLPDLTTFSSQTFDTLKLDSAVRSYLPTKSTNSYSLFMPFSVNVVFSKPLLHDKLVLSFGLQYRYLPKYFVYGFVKANYFIQKDLLVSVSAGGGGYSKFNLGFELVKCWKHFDFSIGTPNLIGLCAPNHYYGAGLYLKLGTSF
ncbi:MAG: DUF5723 family protein [Bacteroidetes bacterium]|nr:DUF5723 family protein [Bacteroidota bacterium]